VPIEKIKGAKELLKEIEDKKMRHLVRYSGTENLLRILIEGEHKRELKEMMEKSVSFFTKALA
jgi:phosphoglucosamine mutase